MHFFHNKSFLYLDSSGEPRIQNGLWILSGLLLFTIVEKILSCTKSSYIEADDDSDSSQILMNNNNNNKKSDKNPPKHVSFYFIRMFKPNRVDILPKGNDRSDVQMQVIIS